MFSDYLSASKSIKSPALMISSQLLSNIESLPLNTVDLPSASAIVSLVWFLAEGEPSECNIQEQRLKTKQRQLVQCLSNITVASGKRVNIAQVTRAPYIDNNANVSTNLALT